MTRKILKTMICFIILLTVFRFCEPVVAKTVKKPMVIFNSQKTVIGIEEAFGSKIWIRWHKKKARYTFTTTNRNVLRIEQYENASGVPYILVFGLKEGNAKVKVKQTYQGRTEVLDTISFAVKAPVLFPYPIDIPLSQVFYKNGIKTVYYYDTIKYKNSEASYIFTTKDSDILTLQKDGIIRAVFNEGLARVEVTEKYKGKKRKLGVIEVNIVKPEYDSRDFTLKEETGEYNPNYRLNFPNYGSELVNYSILTENGEDGTDYLKVKYRSHETGGCTLAARKAGSVTVLVTLKDTGEQIGKFTVTIEETSK